MTIRRLALVVPIAAFASALRAQGGGAPPTAGIDVTGVGDTSIFAPIPTRPGNMFRSGSGMPGPKYWQQKADYDLKATIDTAAKRVNGAMMLRYTNNSPDTLRYIWFQTEQNAFKAGSLNSYIFPPTSRFGALNFEGGDVIEHFDQLTGPATKPVRKALTLRDNETVTRVDLAAPLAPGQTATFDVAWHFNVPEHGADRMGRDGALYEIAQWYPRVNVYDDLRGWNTEPYLGQGEFYLEYGDYTLEVTVPAGYIVAATGALENARDVLTPAQIARLAQAAKSDQTVNIITAGGAEERRRAAEGERDADLEVPVEERARRRLRGEPRLHVGRVELERPHGVRLLPAVGDRHLEGRGRHVADVDPGVLRALVPYPWPQISAVEGPISGMEYPMLAMENKSADKYDLYNVVTHEIGHMWYPMIVGSNERMHMWQDEGFNTFINYFSEARRYPEKGDYAARVRSDREQAVEALHEGAASTSRSRSAPTASIRNILGENAYVKTAVGLSSCATRSSAPPRSTTRSANTRGAGRSSTRRRKISTRRWKTRRGGGSTTSGASGSSRTRTSTRRSTPWCSARSAESIPSRCGSRIARAACCRSTPGSPSTTGQSRTSTTRPKCGRRTRRSIFAATGSPGRRSRRSSSIPIIDCWISIGRTTSGLREPNNSAFLDQDSPAARW